MFSWNLFSYFLHNKTKQQTFIGKVRVWRTLVRKLTIKCRSFDYKLNDLCCYDSHVLKKIKTLVNLRCGKLHIWMKSAMKTKGKSWISIRVWYIFFTIVFDVFLLLLFNFKIVSFTDLCRKNTFHKSDENTLQLKTVVCSQY